MRRTVVRTHIHGSAMLNVSHAILCMFFLTSRHDSSLQQKYRIEHYHVTHETLCNNDFDKRSGQGRSLIQPREFHRKFTLALAKNCRFGL